MEQDDQGESKYQAQLQGIGYDFADTMILLASFELGTIGVMAIRTPTISKSSG